MGSGQSWSYWHEFTVIRNVFCLLIFKVIIKNKKKDSGNSVNSNIQVTGYQLVKTISPAIGSINGGSLLTISGNGFTLNTTVLIGSSVCNVTYVSLDQLICITSPHGPGTVSFVIK